MLHTARTHYPSREEEEEAPVGEAGPGPDLRQAEVGSLPLLEHPCLYFLVRLLSFLFAATKVKRIKKSTIAAGKQEITSSESFGVHVKCKNQRLDPWPHEMAQHPFPSSLHRCPKSVACRAFIAALQRMSAFCFFLCVQQDVVEEAVGT